MNSFNVINQTVDDKFACRSLSQFFDSSNKEYANLKGAIQEVSVSDEIYEIDPFLDDVMRKYNLMEDQLVTMPNGFVKAGNVVRSIFNRMAIYADFPDLDYNPLDEPVIAVYDKDGRLLTSEYLSPTTVMEQINSNYEASVATAAALWASAYDSVSDRLQVFKDKVANYLDDTYTSGSNLAIMLKNKLMEPEFAPSSMINWLSSAMGVDDRVNSDSSSDKSDIYLYTGCNPLSTLDFSYAGQALATTGRIIATSVAGLFNLIKSGARWLGRKVYQTTVNPMDLKLLNPLGNNTIDGWSIDERDTYNLLKVYNGEEYVLNNILNKWYKFDNVFGEILASCTDYSVYNESNDQYSVSGLSKVRLKPVSPEAVAWSDGITGYDLFHYDAEAKRFSWNITSATPNMVLSSIANIKNYGDWRPQVDSDNESYMHMCFKISAHLIVLYLYCMWLVVDGKGEVPIPGASDYSGAVTYQEVVTNADFVQIASGWNKLVDTPAFSWANIVDGFTRPMGNVSLTWYIIPMLCNQQLHKARNPLNYTFLPYLKDVEAFSAPMYNIKTDAENAQAFNAFVTGAIAVIIIATIAVSAVVIANKISRDLFMKRTAYLSKCDAKLINGEKLSILEQARYIRIKRKLNAFTLLNGGLKLKDVSSLGDLTLFNNEPNYTSTLRSIESSVQDASTKSDVNQIVRLIKA